MPDPADMMSGITEEDLKRLRKAASSLAARVQGDDDGMSAVDSEDPDEEISVTGIDDKVRKQQILPSIDDPKLW